LAAGTVKFFLERIGSHDRVTSVTQESQNVFAVERDGMTPIRAWVCDVYVVGIADYAHMIEQEPDIDCIVTMSGYNSWSPEAKNQGYEDEVGVFKFGEFMGALNYEGHDFVQYEPPSRF